MCTELVSAKTDDYFCLICFIEQMTQIGRVCSNVNWDTEHTVHKSTARWFTLLHNSSPSGEGAFKNEAS